MIFKEQNRFPENLKSLIKARGCTYEEFAQAISPKNALFSKSKISKWTSGISSPSNDMLYRIAQYFDVTMEQLLYADFANLPAEQHHFTLDTLLSITRVCLPYITSPEAEKDPYFNKGYQQTCLVWEKINKTKPIPPQEVARAIDYYDQSIQQNHTPEAACNLISCLLLFWFNICNNDLKQKLQYFTNDISGVLKKVFIGKLLFTQKELEAQEQFLSDCDEILNNCLILLKNSENHSQLADFYLAIRYISNCIVNDNSQTINGKIGIAMMLSFAEFGNIYALNWWEVIQEISVK